MPTAAEKYEIKRKQNLLKRLKKEAGKNKNKNYGQPISLFDKVRAEIALKSINPIRNI